MSVTMMVMIDDDNHDSDDDSEEKGIKNEYEIVQYKNSINS